MISRSPSAEAMLIWGKFVLRSGFNRCSVKSIHYDDAQNILFATGALALQAQQRFTRQANRQPVALPQDPPRRSRQVSRVLLPRHPNCEVTAVTDLRTDRRTRLGSLSLQGRL